MAKKCKKQRKIHNYTQEDMDAALSSVRTKKVSMYEAAIRFRVPEASLRRHVKKEKEADKSELKAIRSGTKLAPKKEDVEKSRRPKSIDIQQIKTDFVYECDKWFHAESDPSCKSKAADALSKAIRLYEGETKGESTEQNVDIKIVKDW